VHCDRIGRAAAMGSFDIERPRVPAETRNGDPKNASLGVTWPTRPKVLSFDATPTAKALSVQ